MRTTIDLTPEAYTIAKAVARDRKESLGKVVSAFIVARRETTPNRFRKSAAGFPTFETDRRVTSEDVASLEDE
ncbi:MAG: antitoxin [Bryobacteraceae bacterium]